MIERKGAKSGSDKKKSFFILKCFFILLFVFLIGLVCVFFVMDIFSQKSFICGDNTTNGNCSINKPYFCVNGTLLEDAFVCGCPEILNEEKGLCVSDYHKDPKNIQLKYILIRGILKIRTIQRREKKGKRPEVMLQCRKKQTVNLHKTPRMQML